MMKLVTVVGARPQFIKCGPVSRAVRQSMTEVLVHTGQHYDQAMSDVFFRDLDIPAPDDELNVGSGTHAAQTGQMLQGIEDVLLRESPDACLVYGDTNSTLAAALAAAKLHIPVAHVEAGLRSFNRRMPEEINRVLTDHVSSLLFCPTSEAVANLKREGITAGVHQVGNVMQDALWEAAQRAEADSTVLARHELAPGNYYLATVHRADNTDQPENLLGILQALQTLAAGGRRVVFPVHPRTRKCLSAVQDSAYSRLDLIEPLPYLDMVRLIQQAALVLTDSGGLQNEASWLAVPCVTLREETEWPETVRGGWNVLAGADPQRILAGVEQLTNGKSRGREPVARDNAAERIREMLLKFLN